MTLPIEGNQVTITYAGTAAESGMSGRVIAEGTEVGTFTGKKQGSGEN